MTILYIPADPNNRVIYGSSVDFGVARATAVGMEATSVASHTVGSTTGYYNFRSAFKFNTAIGVPLANILSAKLQVAITTQHSAVDGGCYLEVFKANWSAYDPVDAGNMENTYDTLIAGTADASITGLDGAAVGTLCQSGALDKTWLNLSGNTYYGLINNRDWNNVAPTGDDRWYIGARGNADSALWPYLIIEHNYVGMSSTVVSDEVGVAI